ncbi:vitelline membrane protein Vm32E-like [Episyrphus balteatus]|uniref:vitelline membrane protein Vm32E-like n=1 Tax=Episyrphus balteatus TaxID=286459 RepID=UPI0024851D19|nr:vitelline membrane protein Vm32E-like [Episyrphus balteatus]
MKFFAALIAFAAVACVVLADKTDKKEGMVASSYGAPAAPSYGGGASYSAPPCPKNYLFSCQPNLAPVPCAAGGYAGAYSEQVPQYLLPQYQYPQYAPQH